MFRAISSRVTLLATTAESRKHQHHRHYAHGYVISGHAASNCAVMPKLDRSPSASWSLAGIADQGHPESIYAVMPKLNRSLPASWNLAGLANQDSSISLKMSAGFEARNHPRQLKHVGTSADAGLGCSDDDVNTTYGAGSFFSSIGSKLGEIFNSLTAPKHDTLVLRRGGVVNVPRGQPVSEAEWAALETGRKVKFGPRIGVTLIPSRGERYPTPAHKAACFVSGHEVARESRRISSGGEGNAEWAALLAETRQDAWRARETIKQAQLQKQEEEEEEEQEEQQQQQQQQRRQRHDTETAALTFFEIFGLIFA